MGQKRERTPEEAAARLARFDAFIERLQRDPFEAIDEPDEAQDEQRKKLDALFERLRANPLFRFVGPDGEGVIIGGGFQSAPKTKT